MVERGSGEEEDSSTGQTGKFQLVLWQLWMWDGTRCCWNYLAGSFENPLPPQCRPTPPSLSQTEKLSQTFLQKGKNLAQPEFGMVKHLAMISVCLLKHLQHFDAVGDVEKMLLGWGAAPVIYQKILLCTDRRQNREKYSDHVPLILEASQIAPIPHVQYQFPSP